MDTRVPQAPLNHSLIEKMAAATRSPVQLLEELAAMSGKPLLPFTGRFPVDNQDDDDDDIWAEPPPASPKRPGENDHDRVSRHRYEGFVKRAHDARHQRLPYNRNTKKVMISKGPHSGPPSEVKVPEVGCLVHCSDTGYGCGTESNWIVIAISYKKKSNEPQKLHLRQVYGIDIGIGEADAMPGEPGLVAVDEDKDPLVLTLQWTKNSAKGVWEASWNYYDTMHKWWDSDFWTLGVYRPSDMGFDK